MSEQQPQAQIHHNTSVVQVYPTGAMICHCSTCGYTMVLYYFPTDDGLAPRHKRIVLVEGDPNALHNVPYPGLTFAGMDWAATPENEGNADDCPLSDALREAIEKALGGQDDSQI